MLSVFLLCTKYRLKMKNIDNYLREFESKELVISFIKKKFGYEIPAAKALEINAAFSQSREYFKSYQKADITVKPLLQYYAVVALSRALILILNRKSRENNIVPSHGLKIKNWPEVAKNGAFENIKLKSSSGTFMELLNATSNNNYYRVANSGINWNINYPIPPLETEFIFNEIALGFPDLYQSVSKWLDKKTSWAIVQKATANKLTKRNEIEVFGTPSTDTILSLFPANRFDNLSTGKIINNTLISFDSNDIPHIVQNWEGFHPTIGDAYIVTPFSNGNEINDISKMFAISFILGTISRYYPSTWSGITKNISNDRILPFIIMWMDFIQDKFPKIVVDFIDAPIKDSSNNEPLEG